MTADPSATAKRARWHALEPERVLESLNGAPTGLSVSEAARRIEQFGPNGLPESPPPPWWRSLFAQFTSPLVLILVVAGVVTLLLGEHIDAIAIAAVVLLNAGIGFTQERRAENAVRSLMSLLTPRARAIRDGEVLEVPSLELVPGDVVLLESGDRVPADLRLMHVTALSVDESLLTGESLPVRKHVQPVPAETALADRKNMVYAGAIVASGRARGIVVATGGETELGEIAGEMRAVQGVKTPLEVRLQRFARTIGGIVTAAALLAFAIGVATGKEAGEMFTTAVALAVATVPEGLPVAFTIAMAIGVRRMAKRNAIVRWLPSVEALGSTTVIGSDKTGTLTLNQMTVQRVWSPGSSIDLAETADIALDAGLTRVLLAGVMTNESSLHADGTSTGDPTEVALLLATAAFGLDPNAARNATSTITELPFEAERQFSASVRAHKGHATLYVKGAPERVLTMCDRGPDREPLDHEAALSAARRMAADGLRVLAFASVDAHPDQIDIERPAGLTFLGFQGMADPTRPGARDAIARCTGAGIRVVMITGDHAVTAAAISRELGLPSEPVLTGADLATLDPGAFDRAVATCSVFARVSPEQKLTIVQSLERSGAVVAVTGDGVNDAPALRAAAIGIAMGQRGTDVAKEAADIVLADDNFVSIAAAVEEGRVTFANIRNVTFFLLSSNGGELLLILAALVLGWPLPLLAAQILWLNLVTDSLQVVGIAFEPGAPDAMGQPPRSTREGILPRVLWERVGLSSLVMAAGTLALFWWERDRGASLAAAQTVALTTMVLFQTVQAFNARSADRSIFRMSPLSNPILLAAALGALTLHVVAILAPPTRYLLHAEPLGWEEWLRATLVATTALAVVELHKAIRGRA